MAQPTDKKKRGFAFTRWRVSNRGSVAHLRVGPSPRTICGETITDTAKPVEPSGVNPPCQDCDRVLRAAAERDDDSGE